MSKQINRPPTYCKDAIASSLGWSNPKTGELLISNKSLDLDLIDENYPNQVKYPVPKKTLEEINNDSIDVLLEELEIDETELIKKELDDNIIDELIKQAEAVPMVFEEEDSIDYSKMTKSKLVEHAKDVYGVSLNKRNNKDKLIKEIKDLAEK